jgi:hypothetical protein
MASNQNPDANQNVSQSMTPEELKAQITSGLTAADGVATQSVADLKLVHQARLSQLTRTAAALTAKYGAGDPRAKSAQAAVNATTATVSRVSMLHQQTATPAPTVAATGWALHGRVFNAQVQPVSAYTVFLVDAQKNYMQSLGFAYTDDTGYFLINYGGPQGTQASATSDAPAPGQTGASAPQLFLEIANTKALPVHLSTIAFQPNVGGATYQNVILPAGEPPIGDPPPAIRAVALPNQPKKKS